MFTFIAVDKNKKEVEEGSTFFYKERHWQPKNCMALPAVGCLLKFSICGLTSRYRQSSL